MRARLSLPCDITDVRVGKRSFARRLSMSTGQCVRERRVVVAGSRYRPWWPSLSKLRLANFAPGKFLHRAKLSSSRQRVINGHRLESVHFDISIAPVQQWIRFRKSRINHSVLCCSFFSSFSFRSRSGSFDSIAAVKKSRRHSAPR